MENLQVFNRDIIPVYTTDKGEKVVIGWELHDALSIGKDYSTWFKDMCAYGFTEGEEFSPISGKISEQGGRPLHHDSRHGKAKAPALCIWPELDSYCLLRLI